ncbi:MAG: hypothetical protein PVG30_07865 [Gammaproteobacteria bacterium]|jgi:hypothetical protein
MSKTIILLTVVYNDGIGDMFHHFSFYNMLSPQIKRNHQIINIICVQKDVKDKLKKTAKEHIKQNLHFILWNKSHKESKNNLEAYLKKNKKLREAFKNTIAVAYISTPGNDFIPINFLKQFIKKETRYISVQEIHEHGANLSNYKRHNHFNVVRLGFNIEEKGIFILPNKIASVERGLNALKELNKLYPELVAQIFGKYSKKDNPFNDVLVIPAFTHSAENLLKIVQSLDNSPLFEQYKRIVYVAKHALPELKSKKSLIVKIFFLPKKEYNLILNLAQKIIIVRGDNDLQKAIARKLLFVYDLPRSKGVFNFDYKSNVLKDLVAVIKVKGSGKNYSNLWEQNLQFHIARDDNVSHDQFGYLTKYNIDVKKHKELIEFFLLQSKFEYRKIGKFVDEALFKDWQDFCGVLHKEYDFYKNGKPIVDKWIMRAKIYESCKQQEDKPVMRKLEIKYAEELLNKFQKNGALPEAIFLKKQITVKESHEDIVNKCLINLKQNNINYFDLEALKKLRKENLININDKLLNPIFKKGHNKILKLFLDQGDSPELFYDKAMQYERYQMIQLLELYKFAKSNGCKIKKSGRLTNEYMIVLFNNEDLVLMQFNKKGERQKTITIDKEVKNLIISSMCNDLVIVKANELLFYKYKNVSDIKKKKFCMRATGEFRKEELLALSPNRKYLVRCLGTRVALYSISKRIELLLTINLPLIHNKQPIEIKIDNGALMSYKFFKPYNGRQVYEKKVSLQGSLTQSVVLNHKL